MTEAHPVSAYRWVVLAAASVFMMAGFGGLLTVSVFLKPLAAEFGWLRGAVAFAYFAGTICTGLGSMFWGWQVDRVRVRPILLMGALALGGVFLGLSVLQARWQLYLLYGLMGGFCVGAYLSPLLTLVGFAFERFRGLALGILTAGQSLGGALVPYVAGLLIAQWDWRTAYAALGVAAWVLLLPLVFAIRQPAAMTAAQEGARDRSAPREAPPGTVSVVRAAGLLCVAFTASATCMSIPMVHVVALAGDSGIAPARAAGALSVLMVAGVVGRVGIGSVADRAGGIPALLMASALQTVFIFWFTQVSGVAAFYAIASLFGLGYGGVVPTYAFILREFVPPHLLGRTTGITYLFGNIGNGLGGFLGGLLFDLTGSYVVSYGFGAGMGATNLALVTALWVYLRTHGAQPAHGAAA